MKTSASFEFEATSLTAATFECSLDEPTPEWGSCEASQLYEGLLPGEHELLVRAVNELGVFDATPARHRWTQESLDTFVDAGPDEATESSTATFEFSSDYPGATFECLLDDAVSYQPCSRPPSTPAWRSASTSCWCGRRRRPARSTRPRPSGAGRSARSRSP